MDWSLYLFILATAAVGGCLYLSHRPSQSKTQIWNQLDVIGVSSGSRFAFLGAIISSVISTRELAHKGYLEFNKALDRPYALPTSWVRSGLVMVLPASFIPLLARPDKMRDGEWTNLRGMVETIQLPYIIKDPEIYQNVLHFDVVRRHMTTGRDVARLTPVTADELDRAYCDILGMDSGWKTINGWEACGRVISRASQRILIGLPLSRDKQILETSRQYANSLLVGGAFIKCFPPQIRWLVAPVVTLRARYFQWRFVKMLLPLVEERIHLWETAESMTGKGKDEGLPDDFLQWMIPICAKDGPEQLEPTRIALRLVSLLTPLIFAVCYVFSHCVLDIHGSSSRDDILAGLEEECARVCGEGDGSLGSKASVDALSRIDSALRESMRFSDVAVTNLFRDVIAGEVDIGNGIRVGEGVRMVFPTQDIHHDANNYTDPKRYDAFRFSRPHEKDMVQIAEKKSEGKKEEQELIATTTPTFLPFGYGRHACPGRWFAAQLMKQALAYLVMHYDVELWVDRLRDRPC
jgi:cytochrome P450